MKKSELDTLEHDIRQSVIGPDEIMIDKPCKIGEVVYSNNFGVSPDSEECSYSALARAIDYCREVKASKLIIPKGKYHFKAQLKYNEAYIDLNGMSDFILDGQGSEFIFFHVHSYIFMRNCERAVVKDLYLDWDWDVCPLTSIGKVISVDANGQYFDCQFPTYKEIPEHIEIRIVGPIDSRNLTPGCAGGLEFRPYKNNHVVAANDGTDKEMDNLVRELSNIIKSMKKINSNTMRFYTVNAAWCVESIQKDQMYNFRHYEYNAPGIILSDSSHISFRNVVIYSCPGTGIVGFGDLHHFEFNGCKIIRRPGTDRFISSTADCLHIANSQGYFKIENCEFAHAGDDCINIHDNTSMGIVVIDKNTINAKRVAQGRNNFHVGDLIELRNSDLSSANFCSRVISLEYNHVDRTCKLTFEDVLPENLDNNAIIFNRRYNTSNYIIRNNHFHSNRARGILIHGSNGLIEKNKFYRIQGAAIQIETGAEHRWAEGTGVKNVILRENWIESCDVNRWVMSVVYLGVYLPKGRTSYPVFDGIIFESNTVVDCPRLAFFFSSCANILVSKNIIINSNTSVNDGKVFGSSQQELPIYGECYGGSIMFSYAKDIVIKENKRIQTLEAFDNGIFMGPCTANILESENTGYIG